MKFWHKILLIVLLLFIITLDISVVIIMQRSWELNINREISRASSEQALIANNVFDNLTSIGARGAVLNENVYYDVIRSYGSYYANQGVELQLWENSRLVYSTNQNGNFEMPNATTEQLEQGGIHYIQIANKLPSPHDSLLLVYKRNINSLFDMQESINQLFICINFAMGICLIFFLYLAIKYLSKPLLMLSETTEQIADGNFEKRVTLNSKDEFGELAYNFNKMADAVEQHIHQLSHMADDKQRLADNLAHELRTPLTSMQGFAEYLLNANSSEEDKIIAAGYIKSETLRLNQLANKLLDISNLKHESFMLNPIKVEDLFSIVAGIEEPRLRLSNQTLSVSNSIDAVLGDFDLLVSFLNNCIENAIHASNQGAQISLSAFSENGLAVLEVSDNGCGMSEEESKKAFEAFYRADKSRSREHGGAGLGLALCKQIAETHNAKLNVYSKIGVGTKIQIILQLHNNYIDTP